MAEAEATRFGLLAEAERDAQEYLQRPEPTNQCRQPLPRTMVNTTLHKIDRYVWTCVMMTMTMTKAVMMRVMTITAAVGAAVTTTLHGCVTR